jgi:universal stress protein A
MSTYKNLLLAVDFSKNTDDVINKGLALAEAFEARISLVHVVEFAQVDLSNELVMPQELELDQELLALAEKRMQELVDKYGLQDKTRFVRQGSTKREILNIAEQEGIDLIIIGSHGREGLQLLLGSTANAVLHGAPCDVLAVRVRD